MSAATDMELAERALDEAWELKMLRERELGAIKVAVANAEYDLTSAQRLLQLAHADYMVQWRKENPGVPDPVVLTDEQAATIEKAGGL